MSKLHTTVCRLVVAEFRAMLLLFSCCSSADKRAVSFTHCDIHSAGRGRAFRMDRTLARRHANGADGARWPGVPAPKRLVGCPRGAAATLLLMRTSPARWRRSAAKCGQRRAEAAHAVPEARE